MEIGNRDIRDYPKKKCMSPWRLVEALNKPSRKKGFDENIFRTIKYTLFVRIHFLIYVYHDSIFAYRRLDLL